MYVFTCMSGEQLRDQCAQLRISGKGNKQTLINNIRDKLKIRNLTGLVSQSGSTNLTGIIGIIWMMQNRDNIMNIII